MTSVGNYIPFYHPQKATIFVFKAFSVLNYLPCPKVKNFHSEGVFFNHSVVMQWCSYFLVTKTVLHTFMQMCSYFTYSREACISWWVKM
jgi:hypothetical protein